MPRKPRFYLPGVPSHMVQRGHSREAVFFEKDDYAVYLGWMEEAARRNDCALHAYVLMTNHVHILATPGKQDSISRMMQYVGRRYVPYINATYGTSGSIGEGRYKASMIHDEEYLLFQYRVEESVFYRNPKVRDAVAREGRFNQRSDQLEVLAIPNQESGVLMVGPPVPSRL